MPEFHAMKVLTVDEARERLDAVCEEALAGEVIRLQRTNGSLLELTPVPAVSWIAPLSAQQLADCYEDTEWAEFENHCAKASD
jgi:hypothetical protein